MASTPALPMFGSSGPSVDMRFDASRQVPPVLQPDFGIVGYPQLPGLGPKANAFFNAQLAYANVAPIGYPDLYLNMPNNMYPFGYAGIANYQNNSGSAG